MGGSERQRTSINKAKHCDTLVYHHKNQRERASRERLPRSGGRRLSAVRAPSAPGGSGPPSLALFGPPSPSPLAVRAPPPLVRGSVPSLHSRGSGPPHFHFLLYYQSHRKKGYFIAGNRLKSNLPKQKSYKTRHLRIL